MNLSRWIASCVGAVVVVTAVAFSSPALADDKDLSYTWNLGDKADVDPGQVPRIEPDDRIGGTGADGDIKYRELKPNVYQVQFIMPAFDFDAANFGAVNHSFFLSIRFKDIAKAPVVVWAGKGGEGFYGAGYVGSFGGAGDGQWKTETIVVRRSMLRTIDGKTFRFPMNNIKAAIPIASMTLFSGGSPLPGTADKVAAAIKAESDKRDALRKKLLPQFKDLGLPEAGAAPAFTEAEKAQGFRVFFPPVSRQLFSNSQPLEGEMTDAVHLYACPGQTISLVAAIRGVKDVGNVTLDWRTPFPRLTKEMPPPLDQVTEAYRGPRWAVYSEQRIGSSWGKDFRVCPEQLVLGKSHEVAPDRLEIAVIPIAVPAGTPAGDIKTQLTITAEKGGKKVIPITVTVYPFKLEQPANSTHGQFYYIDYGNFSPFEVIDMADHGMNTVVCGLDAPLAEGPDGKRDTSGPRAAFKFFKSHGYRAPLIDGTGNMNTMLKDEKNRKKYTEIIAETQGIAKEEGFEPMGFFPVDEPHAADAQALAKIACTWTKDVKGALTYITSNPDAVKVLDPVLDYVCYNLSYLNDATIKSMKPHQKLMFYCPSFDVNPEPNRYVSGFYMFKVGAYSTQYYAYMELEGDPFFDLDGGNRDWTVVLPSLDSPFHDPTIQWESQREGVYDYQFCYTLQATADRARKAGKTAEADKAMKVLADILAGVDSDGNKAGGPAIAIEADVRLKDKQLDPKLLAQTKALIGSAWYEQSRRKIAQSIIDLKKAMGEIRAGRAS